jgi:hypothetical protein
MTDDEILGTNRDDTIDILGKDSFVAGSKKAVNYTS